MSKIEIKKRGMIYRYLMILMALVPLADSGTAAGNATEKIRRGWNLSDTGSWNHKARR